MSTKLKEQWCFIQLFIETSTPQRLALIKSISVIQLNLLCEILLNVLKGTLYLPSEEVKKLSRHQSFLRRFTSKETSLKRKKQDLKSHYKVVLYILEKVRPLLDTLRT